MDRFNRAVELDPKYVTAHEGCLRIRRELTIDQSPAQGWLDMADRARRILEIDDTSFAAECRLADKLLAYDYDWDGGIAAKDRQRAIWPDKNLTWTFFFRQVGHTNEARVYHERLKREPELDLHAALGDTNQALACLNKAIDYHSEYITNPDYGGLRTDPAWDDLRDDPHFDALCRRVGMGQGQWPK